MEMCEEHETKLLELCNRGQRDRVKELEEVYKAKQRAEAPKVTYEVYRKNERTGRLEKIREFKSDLEADIRVFKVIGKYIDGNYNIIVQRDITGKTLYMQEFKVNGEPHIMTFTHRHTMQEAFEQWARNMKTDLYIESSTGVIHECIYNKEFNTANFY